MRPDGSRRWFVRFREGAFASIDKADTDIEIKQGKQQNANLLLLLLYSFPPAPISSHGYNFLPNAAPVETHQCRWIECTETFTDAEVLYEHITSTHIGRKCAGTLSSECKWFGCSKNLKFSKRHNLTNHMRVHIDLKPHSCDVSTADCHPSSFSKSGPGLNLTTFGCPSP